MEGPFLLLKACVLTWVLLWAYRRWERYGPRDPAFRARCRRGLVVAVIEAPRAFERREAVTAALAGGVVAGAGRAPWPWHALALVVEPRGEHALYLRTTDARRVRVHGAPPPRLFDVLDALGLERAWVHPELWVDVLSDAPTPEAGWTRTAEGCAPADAAPIDALPLRARA